jgi:transposase-like protein
MSARDLRRWRAQLTRAGRTAISSIGKTTLPALRHALEPPVEVRAAQREELRGQQQQRSCQPHFQTSQRTQPGEVKGTRQLKAMILACCQTLG